MKKDKFISVNDKLPCFNALCECKTKVNSYVKARFIYNSLAYGLLGSFVNNNHFWRMEDGSFIVSPTHWRYVYDSYKEEAMAWFTEIPGTEISKRVKQLFYKTSDGRQVSKIDDDNFEIINGDSSIIPVDHALKT